jgi:AmmeMemoRadiSam system protein B
MDRPKLRDLELIPVKDGLWALRDPSGYADGMLLIPDPLLPVLALFDGKLSLDGIRREVFRRTGERLEPGKLREIADRLDGALFLENDRFAAHRLRAEEEYRRAPQRPMSHAGSAYAADPGELARQIGGYYTGAGGPGLPDLSAPSGDLQAVIAPHIDPARGGIGYAHSYHAVGRGSRARVFLVLGISHAPTINRYAVGRKDFLTPLGVVRTDAALAEEIAGQCGFDAFADEFAHRREHSVEFQAVFLRHLHPRREELRIVPILCSAFTGRPGGDPQVRGMTEALSRVVRRLGGEACLIAAADLSHIGPRFGDTEPLTDGFVRQGRKEDGERLALVTALDAEGFYAAIEREGDKRRVCGVPAIYALLRVLDGKGRAELLHHGMAADPEAGSAVGFASVAFYRGR